MLIRNNDDNAAIKLVSMRRESHAKTWLPTFPDLIVPERLAQTHMIGHMIEDLIGDELI